MSTEPCRISEGSALHADDPDPLRQYWYTADDLVDTFGYRRDALEGLFGEATPGPGGLVGWTTSVVWKIESEVIVPAVELLESSFRDQESIDLTVYRSSAG